MTAGARHSIQRWDVACFCNNKSSGQPYRSFRVASSTGRLTKQQCINAYGYPVIEGIVSFQVKHTMFPTTRKNRTSVVTQLYQGVHISLRLPCWPTKNTHVWLQLKYHIMSRRLPYFILDPSMLSSNRMCSWFVKNSQQKKSAVVLTKLASQSKIPYATLDHVFGHCVSHTKKENCICTRSALPRLTLVNQKAQCQSVR